MPFSRVFIERLSYSLVPTTEGYTLEHYVKRFWHNALDTFHGSMKRYVDNLLS